MKYKIILFGASLRAEKLLEEHNNWDEEFDVIAIMDSNNAKCGTKLWGVEIVSVEKGLQLKWDYVVICSKKWYEEQWDTLTDKGVDPKRILPFHSISNIKKLKRQKETLLDKERTGLVVIFNHKHEKNLPVLRRIYGQRYSEILFLMPFYSGNDKDVIKVCDSSWNFHGFLAQAYDRIRDMNCEYYLFVGDDLFLNPRFNEWNSAKLLGLEGKDVYAFMPTELNKEGNYGWSWFRGRWALQPFLKSGLNWKDELPSREEAFRLFEDFLGREYRHTYEDDIFAGTEATKQDIEKFLEANGNSRDVLYPLAMAYSDIFALRKRQLKAFSDMLGVFAAMNVFVEIATPTTTILTTPRKSFSSQDDSAFEFEKCIWDDEGKIYIEKKI